MSDSSYTVTGGSQPSNNVKRLNVIPIQQQTTTTQPYEVQPEPSKQVTLAQSDLGNVNAEMLFDPQEIEFMNRLNVDSEVKKKTIPVFDSTETSIEVSQSQPKKVNVEEEKIYVAKCISRQVMINTLASMEQDFYDKVSICSDSMTESSFFYLEEFIYKRLGLIVQYSKSFSLNVSEKLTNEERELYQGLSELVNRYKQMIDKKVGLSK